MKEIKAYVQKSSVSKLVDRLSNEGAPGITVEDIHPVGYGYDPNHFLIGREHIVLQRYAYLKIVRIEVVCADDDLERLLSLICEVCSTGEKGDGMIFVSDVSSAVRIRDRCTGDAAL